MALLEGSVKGWGGIVVGFGAALLAPAILPATRATVRPLLKVLVKGALFVGDQVRGIVSEATEQVNDLVAEVRAETESNGRGRGPAMHRHH